MLGDLSEYHAAREDTILFGRQVEMMDVRHSENGLDMRVVPITQEEFKIHANPRFVKFMGTFGIQKSAKG